LRTFRTKQRRPVAIPFLKLKINECVGAKGAEKGDEPQQECKSSQPKYGTLDALFVKVKLKIGDFCGKQKANQQNTLGGYKFVDDATGREVFHSPDFTENGQGGTEVRATKKHPGQAGEQKNEEHVDAVLQHFCEM